MKTQAILRSGAATFAVGLALAGAPAFAQDAEPAVDESEAIVVTGSRIARPDLEAASQQAFLPTPELLAVLEPMLEKESDE